MKGYLRNIALGAFCLSLGSCFLKKSGKGSRLPDDGQLHGVAPTAFKSMNPPRNMVYVPPGTFHLGPSDEDISYNNTTRNRQVSIPGFWMDATEITNDDYRQFVKWTVDSLAGKILYGQGINKADDTSAVDWKKWPQLNGTGIL
jgi:sulfatase modifying factor 1